jgi:hypothetical protein
MFFLKNKSVLSGWHMKSRYSRSAEMFIKNTIILPFELNFQQFVREKVLRIFLKFRTKFCIFNWVIHLKDLFFILNKVCF